MKLSEAKIRENNKEVAKCIRLTWSSLKSHLDDTFDPINEKVEGSEVLKQVHGDRKFHVRCVHEYAVIIKALVDQIR